MRVLLITVTRPEDFLRAQHPQLIAELVVLEVVHYLALFSMDVLDGELVCLLSLAFPWR